MKSLTASLSLQLLLGGMVAISASLGVQAYRFHGRAVAEANANVARAMDDLEWEIGRHRSSALTSALLVAKSGSFESPSAGEDGAVESFAPEVVLDFNGAADPRILLAPETASLAATVEAIRAASVAGVTGADEPTAL